MSTLNNGYHSYFSEAEGVRILAANPAEILGLMHQYDDLDLRFIHDLAARNMNQLALDVLNQSTPNEKPKYIAKLLKKLPREFEYYRETNLPKDQLIYHAFTIPYVLLLAKDGYVSTNPNDNTSNLHAFSQVGEAALFQQFNLLFGIK